MGSSAASSGPLPRGLVAEGDRVTVAYGVGMHVLMWIGFLLPVGTAILIAVVAAQERPGAPILPVVAGMLVVGAIPLALWWYRIRGVQYTFDAEGITKESWRRATVPWAGVEEIRPWGKQIVVRAPGAVHVAGQSKPHSELRLPVTQLATPRPELLRYLRQRWAAARGQRPG